MKNSDIEWTTHSFNPWRGCDELILPDGSTHPACIYCYAKTQARRFPDMLGRWGDQSEGGTRVVAPERMWREVLRWNAAAHKAGERHRVFCASIADVFEDWNGEILTLETTVSADGKERRQDAYPAQIAGNGSFTHGQSSKCPLATMADVRRKLFDLIDKTPWLDWLLLTKRPGNIRVMWPLELIPGTSGLWGQQHRRNVWLGTSISNQQTADELVPQLLSCRELAPVLFLSAEPLLGPVDLRAWVDEISTVRMVSGEYALKTGMKIGDKVRMTPQGGSVDWVIVGGESGSQARPMHPYWARSLRDQCQAAGVPFFFKQWGEHCHWSQTTNEVASRLGSHADGPIRLGKKDAGRLLDGREWNEFPQEVAHA